MAIEGVVADAGTGGSEFAVDSVAGGSGTVVVPYTKLMSGADTSVELIGGDAANGLDVDVTRLPALVAGTNTVGFVGLASNQVLATVTAVTAISNALPAGTNTLGFVGLATNSVLAATQSGTWTVQPGNTANTTAWKVDGSAVTQPVSIATNTPVGVVAHGSTDTGASLRVGLKAESSLAGATMVGDGAKTDAYADVDGVPIVKQNAPWGDLLNARVANTDGSASGISVFGAVASLRNYITQVTIANTHASTHAYVDFLDGTGGAILYTFPAPASGGCVVGFNPPLRQPTAQKMLMFDVSAAVTTVYVSVNGFQSKV